MTNLLQQKKEQKQEGIEGEFSVSESKGASDIDYTKLSESIKAEYQKRHLDISGLKAKTVMLEMEVQDLLKQNSQLRKDNKLKNIRIDELKHKMHFLETKHKEHKEISHSAAVSSSIVDKLNYKIELYKKQLEVERKNADELRQKTKDLQSELDSKTETLKELIDDMTPIEDELLKRKSNIDLLNLDANAKNKLLNHMDERNRELHKKIKEKETRLSALKGQSKELLEKMLIIAEEHRKLLEENMDLKEELMRYKHAEQREHQMQEKIIN
ncbi:hypothetical protein ACFL0W_03985 [Nanoarchaeota archaeon]